MQVWKLRSPMIAEECPKRTEMPMVCWLRCKKERDFPAKIDRSLSTHLWGRRGRVGKGSRVEEVGVRREDNGGVRSGVQEGSKREWI